MVQDFELFFVQKHTDSTLKNSPIMSPYISMIFVEFFFLTKSSTKIDLVRNAETLWVSYYIDGIKSALFKWREDFCISIQQCPKKEKKILGVAFSWIVATPILWERVKKIRRERWFCAAVSQFFTAIPTKHQLFFLAAKIFAKNFAL